MAAPPRSVTVSVNARGQVTLPRAVLSRLHLAAGSRVELRIVDDHSVVIETRTADPMSLAGRLKVDHPMTLDDMETAIAEGAQGR